MNKLKKTLVLVCCAALLVCISVGATVAYLTFQTQVVKNTFTVGKVKIDLDEALVNEAGQELKEDGTVWEEGVDDPETKAERVKANKYKLMPGHEYVKDPTVTLKADSEKSYVRMIVTITDIDDLKAACDVDPFMPEDFVTGWDRSKWPCYSYEEVGNTVVCEFRYYTTVETADKTTDLILEPLFKTIKVPGTATNDEIVELEEMKIDIIADAIQADGFSSPEAAWEAFDGLNEDEIDKD